MYRLRKPTTCHPLELLAFFSSLIVAAIITIIFTLTFNDPETENDVYASAGERDGFVFVGHIFHVDLDLWQMLNRLNPKSITYTGQQFIYPFDDYQSRNTFVAFIPSADGSSSNVTFLPILNVAAVDAAETFVPSHSSVSPVPNATVKFDGTETDKAYVFMLLFGTT
ncbi:hypothetical protein K438DRAFT_1966613 [Mycena galopus ATCC 62051]|nr:hypothetical protein K438DRAFT_1966613 [Mycena galopus ATCC 62051]